MATVGERFQLVIERHARRALNVRPGDRGVESVEDGRLVVTFLPARHRRSLLGRLAGSGTIDDFGSWRDGGSLADQLADEHQPPQQGD